jgi:hypothetical protein
VGAEDEGVLVYEIEGSGCFDDLVAKFLGEKGFVCGGEEGILEDAGDFMIGLGCGVYVLVSF